MNEHVGKHAALDRREAIPRVVGNPDDFLIITGLAGVAQDIAHLTRESPNTFIFGGAMGGATMTGLGLALAQPKRRVLVVTGDGDLLMSLGSLATIAMLKPGNFSILCVDNEHYGETGNQRTHTGSGVNLRAAAEACGFEITREIVEEGQFEDASQVLRGRDGPAFVLLKVTDGLSCRYSRNWDATERKLIFRRALLAS